MLNPELRPPLRVVERDAPVNGVLPVPRDLLSEQATLGAVLNDRDSILRLAGRLTSSDFFYEAHRHIYAAMLRLYRSSPPVPPDCLTVAAELERAGLLALTAVADDPTAGGSTGLAYLLHLYNTCPSPWHIDHYAAKVQEASDERRLITVGGQIGALGFERSAPVADRLAKARQLLGALTRESTTAAEWVGLDTAVSGYLDRLEALDGALSGLSTGIPDLDDATDGLQRGDLIVVKAPTSGGKSALSLALGLHNARAGKRVAVVSLEMSRDQYCQRILAAESGINSTTLRTGRLTDREWTALTSAGGQAATFPLFVNTRRGQTLEDICDSCYRLAAEGPLDLVLVDYLGLVNRRGLRVERDDQALELIAGGLRELAGTLDCPLIAPVQENDEGQIRGSRGIGHAADLVIQIVADLDPRKLNPAYPVPVELVLDKQRNGGKGVVRCLWDLRTNRFLPAETLRTWNG
jgi:replicative DNA helicase